MKEKIETILDEGRFNGLPTRIVAETLVNLGVGQLLLCDEEDLRKRIKDLEGLHSEMVKIGNHQLMRFEKLKAFAEHDEECNKFGEFFRPEDQECTCGLDDIIND